MNANGAEFNPVVERDSPRLWRRKFVPVESEANQTSRTFIEPANDVKSRIFIAFV